MNRTLRIKYGELKYSLFVLFIFGFMIVFMVSCKKDNKEPGSVTDIDGNVYKTVSLGGKIWMAENLKVLHYNDGDPITNVTSNDIWKTMTTEAYCDYNNVEANGNIYGRLYNHYAVSDPRKLCPAGWHVPAYEEWSLLTYYYTRDLKEAGTSHWYSPNAGATNNTGFTALPAGANTIGFTGLGDYCNWWGSYNPPTLSSTGYCYFYNIDDGILWTGGPKFVGRSVRCIKD